MWRSGLVTARTALRPLRSRHSWQPSEAVAGEPPRAAGQIEGLAIAALGEEVNAALAAADPTGAIDTRLLTVGEGLVGMERLAVELQPHLVDLEIRDIGRGNLPNVARTSIAMQAGEIGLFEAQAEILESVAVKGTKGGYAGTRVRVSNDVSVRLGGFGAESSLKRVEMRATDRGTLTVTTERVVFIGAASTVEFDRSAVLTTVTSEPTFFAPPSITFHLERRKPIGFRLNENGVRLLDAILHWQPAPAVPPHLPSAVLPTAVSTATCPSCHQPLGNSWLYCPHCSARLES